MPSEDDKQPNQVEEPSQWRVWLIVAILAVGITLVGSFEAYRGDTWNPEQAGQYGDFVGGYFGTIFFIASLGILYVTYQHQSAHNRRTVFETRFFELLQYHRDNTTEIDLDAVKGRRSFVYLFREWRLLYKLVKNAENKVKAQLTGNERSALAYMAYFNGSGPNGRELLRDRAKKAGFEMVLIDQVIDLMSSDWKVYKEVHAMRNGIPLGTSKSLSFGLAIEEEDLKPVPYVPYGGHHSRLAHYYRHLYHIIKYADMHAPAGTAVEYVDLARAQLTTSEQAFLALHAYSMRGAWDTGDYIQKYHLTKNIPPGYFEAGSFDITAIYPAVPLAG